MMLSVIIPVYNVEPYLSSCLDSVIGQTYQNLEIILVDDGSTDNSGLICDDYALKDMRIQVIHKENGGLSSARNAALDIAKGEYIAFLDSDDYLDTTAFEKCMARLLKTSADVCMFSHYTLNNEECIAHAIPLERDLYQNEEIQKEILPRFIGKKQGERELAGFVCRQVFKRSVIGRIRFRSEREYFAEDVVFDIEVYRSINKFCVLNEPLLYYRYVSSSLSNNYRKDLFKKLQTLLAFMDESLKTNNIEGERERLLETAFKFSFYGCRNVKRGIELTKKEKIQAIKDIATNTFVTESIQKLPRQNIKEKIFAWLLKRKAAGMLLALL